MSPTFDHVVLATRNEKKRVELQAILESALGHPVRVSTARDLDLPEVVEDGVTFAENSLLKARSAARATGLPAIADDSGLAVDVLGGAPGIFSARWSGTHGDDAANNRLLLAQLADVKDEHRGAAFVCAAALVVPGPQDPATEDLAAEAPAADSTPVTEVVEEGRFTGHLLRAPRGANGFGYDPLFVPDGEDRTAAEMSAEEKNSRSHRYLALTALAAHMH
ncbi:non-canonical purine NTP pyrophosphatase [Brevibacterium litoralis]|uniref:non-canonical purine NTP pyrophosphatase n=1 Tax=Brevibacterium litoralis TaxID=3138935 RepID=UPI0032EB9F12